MSSAVWLNSSIRLAVAFVRRPAEDVDGVAVAVAKALDDFELVLVAVAILLDQIEMKLPVLVEHDRAPTRHRVRQLVVGVAELRLPVRGKPDRTGLKVPVPESVLGRLGGELKALLALAQRGFRLHAAADVDADQKHLAVGAVRPDR